MKIQKMMKQNSEKEDKKNRDRRGCENQTNEETDTVTGRRTYRHTDRQIRLMEELNT